jgi:large subunit ribosomal protein L13
MRSGPMRTEHAASARRRETYVAKAGQVERNWKIVDAEGISLGRLSADIAVVLMGKHRPEYTPHVDTGDNVIVINASKVGLSGNKAEGKLKYHYTGYPGGLKAETFGRVRDRKPESLIEDAVRRMLPKSRLGRVMLKKLKVFPGAEHPYQSQQPETMKV